MESFGLASDRVCVNYDKRSVDDSTDFAARSGDGCQWAVLCGPYRSGGLTPGAANEPRFTKMQRMTRHVRYRRTDRIRSGVTGRASQAALASVFLLR